MLNVPPDGRGRIHDDDAQSVREFHHMLAGIFAHDLAREARVTASNVRGGDVRFDAKTLIDGNRDTYWATDDSVTTPEVVLEFGKPITFNVVRLREYLPLGQRIDSFALDQWKDGAWTEFATGTSIGNCRLVRREPITTDKVRVRITKAAACPALSEVGLFAEPTAQETVRPH
jgi:alpha-L-fucosidase